MRKYLQIYKKNLRENLLKSFNEFFLEKSIKFKKSSSYSTPNRLLILFEGVAKKIVLKSEEIKGPSTKSPDAALEGFARSNGVSKKRISLIKKQNKGEFYFYKTRYKKLDTHTLLEGAIPQILNKNSMEKINEMVKL